MFLDHYSSRTQKRKAEIHQSAVHNNEPVQNYSKRAKREYIPAEKLPTQIDSAVVNSVCDRVVLENQQKDLQSEEYKENTQNLLPGINQSNRAKTLDSLEKGNEKIDINAQALISAVYGGDIAIVDRLLACENIDINAPAENGVTALISCFFRQR